MTSVEGIRSHSIVVTCPQNDTTVLLDPGSLSVVLVTGLYAYYASAPGADEVLNFNFAAGSNEYDHLVLTSEREVPLHLFSHPWGGHLGEVFQLSRPAGSNGDLLVSVFFLIQRSRA